MMWPRAGIGHSLALLELAAPDGEGTARGDPLSCVDPGIMAEGSS